MGKEKICEYIIQEDYIKGLVDVMNQAEDLEALADLHALCNLMQTIRKKGTLLPASLINHLFSDDERSCHLRLYSAGRDLYGCHWHVRMWVFRISLNRGVTNTF